MAGPYLEIETSAGRKRLSLGDEPFTIGRHPDNKLVIQDDKASRFHCVIEPTDGGGHVVRNLKSRNGTKVNEERVDKAALHVGDIVRIGGTRLRYLDPSQPEPPSISPEPMAASATTAKSGGRRPSRSGGGGGGGSGDGGGRTFLDEGEPDYNAMLAGMNEITEHPGGGGTDQSILVDDNYAEALEQLSEAGRSDLDLTEGEVALVNARGGVIHPQEGLEATRKDKSKKKADSDTSGKEGLQAVRRMLVVCAQTRATDLHVEPKSTFHQVRIRVDGTMIDVLKLDNHVAARFMGVVKVLADIDLAQRHIIQEGHFSAQLRVRRVDYRVSFTPSMYGQKLVLRVLDLKNAPRYLPDLGLQPWMLDQLRKICRQDTGMVLACGPTGSGKTTTLYAILRDIDARERNVITIEDPVEYEIDNVTQIPIEEVHGNTFNNLLRSILRQDPDVILLGEIRDRETATTAMQAAMTGHLVFSTVHARDTIGSIFRLLDLGIEPYLVASSLNLMIAQRLARLLCPACKVDRKPSSKQVLDMGKFVEGVTTVYHPVGCPKCLNTGFMGRRAIFELLTVTDALRDAVLQNPTLQRFREVTKSSMFTSLAQSGYQLALEGITSVPEIEKVAAVSE
jgi:general secretion pathway protein E